MANLRFWSIIAWEEYPRPESIVRQIGTPFLDLHVVAGARPGGAKRVGIRHHPDREGYAALAKIILDWPELHRWLGAGSLKPGSRSRNDWSAAPLCARVRYAACLARLPQTAMLPQRRAWPRVRSTKSNVQAGPSQASLGEVVFTDQFRHRPGNRQQEHVRRAPSPLDLPRKAGQRGIVSALATGT